MSPAAETRAETLPARDVVLPCDSGLSAPGGAADHTICAPAEPRAAGGMLACDEVELWRIELDAVSPTLEGELRELLAADEFGRAQRFHFERHRRRFIIARGALRCILAGHLGVAPGSIQFGLGSAGKPFVAEPESGRTLSFNVSHSENFALVAVTRTGEIGVDLEQVRPFPDWEQVAAETFSPDQVAELQACPEGDRPVEFFRAWTREEAIVKAQGTGLGGAGSGRASFSIYSFFASPQFIASLAVTPTACGLTCRTWSAGAAVPAGSIHCHRLLLAQAAAHTAVLP